MATKAIDCIGVIIRDVMRLPAKGRLSTKPGNSFFLQALDSNERPAQHRMKWPWETKCVPIFNGVEWCTGQKFRTSTVDLDATLGDLIDANDERGVCVRVKEIHVPLFGVPVASGSRTLPEPHYVCFGPKKVRHYAEVFYDPRVIKKNKEKFLSYWVENAASVSNATAPAAPPAAPPAK